MLYIRLFGTPRLEDDDGVVSGRATQRHPVALLALLATAPESSVSRDKVLALLWPETDTDRARARLNTAVHAIRSAAGAESLVSAGDDLRLDPARISVDVSTFEAAVAQGAHEEAVGLYGGPLLDGFHLGSGTFDRWLDGERDRLRRQYWRSLEALAEAAAGAGRPAAAVEWWQKRAAEEPFSGRVAVKLMEAQVAAGNPAGALRHARVHSQLVEDEFDTPASADVQQLADVIRAGTRAGSNGGSADPGGDDGGRKGEEAAATVLDSRDSGAMPPPPGTRHRRAPTVVTVLLVAAATVVGGFFLLGGTPSRELVEDRIVVLPLQNRTGDPSLDPVGRLAADWITQGVTRAGLGRIMPLSDLLRTFAPGEDVGAMATAETARATGAGIVVTGSYYRVGDELQFQARVLNAGDEALIDAAEPVTTDIDDPRPGIETLRQRVTGILATVLDPRDIFSGGTTTVEGRPPTLEAYEAFADGQDRFFRFRFSEAAPLFLRAAELDPSFQRATLRAIEAYVNMKRWEAVDSLVGVLEANRDRLTRVDRLLLETFQAHSQYRRDAAMERSGRLAELFPNSYMTFGAAWQGTAYNRPERTIRYLESVDPSRGPMSRWLGYWGAYAHAHHLLRDYEAELEIVERGLREFYEPERLLIRLIYPLAALGRFEELREAVERAEATGLWNPGILGRWAARELRAHGHGDRAGPYLDRALEWYGDRNGDRTPRLREGVARTLYLAGRYDSAAVLYRRLLEDAPPMDQGRGREHRMEVRGRLGTLAARRGDTAGARRAENWLTSLEGPYLFGGPEVWRARIAAVLGEHDRAVALLEAGLEKANFGRWVHTDPDLRALHDHPDFRRLVRPQDPGPHPSY